jgi:hypothetical protein
METVKATRAPISEYKLNSPLAWLLVPPPIKLENELRKYGDQTDVRSPRVIKFTPSCVQVNWTFWSGPVVLNAPRRTFFL